MYIKKDILLSVVKHHKLFLQFGLKHSLLYFTDRSCNLQCVSSPELSSYVTQCTISCVSHQGRLHDVCHISERFGAFHFLFSSVKRTAGAGVQPFHSMHVVFLRPPPTQRTSPCCLQQTNKMHHRCCTYPPTQRALHVIRTHSARRRKTVNFFS